MPHRLVPASSFRGRVRAVRVLAEFQDRSRLVCGPLRHNNRKGAGLIGRPTGVGHFSEEEAMKWMLLVFGPHPVETSLSLR
jgi:hypothetical protein